MDHQLEIPEVNRAVGRVLHGLFSVFYAVPVGDIHPFTVCGPYQVALDKAFLLAEEFLLQRVRRGYES